MGNSTRWTKTEVEAKAWCVPQSTLPWHISLHGLRRSFWILFGIAVVEHVWGERLVGCFDMFLMSLPFEYLEHHGFFINLLLLQQRFSLHCFYVRNIFVHSSRWYYIHNNCYVFTAVFGHCLEYLFLVSLLPTTMLQVMVTGPLLWAPQCRTTLPIFWILLDLFRRSFHQSRYPSWHGLLNWIQSTSKWQVDHMLRKALDTCAALVGNVCQ